ncbi:MAG: polysaccharide deacetylase family protein [Chloroflexota bacterium]
MDNYQQRTNQRTNIPIIVLTFIGGVAVGWLLHSFINPPTAQAPVPPIVSDTPLPTLSADPSPTPDSEASFRPTTVAVASPTPIFSPTSTPVAEIATVAIESYTAYTVSANETLEEVAEKGGSTPELIMAYNRLTEPPQPEQTIIIPQRVGQTNSLEQELILIRRGTPERPWVALTLDGGAGAEPVPRMLDVLDERDIQITFFLTGVWVEEHPELAQRIVDDGHEVANHSYSHSDFTQLSDDAIRQELADTEAIVRETTGVSSRPFFRPPYGAYDDRILRLVQEEGYISIYWTLDSLDSFGEPKTADFLVERVTTTLTPAESHGAIILVHCGNDTTADALPRILDQFAAMGLEIKKLSEVIRF